jgi:hypothetical protein
VTPDQLFASPWGALAIFALRIVDVSCDTMRVLFAIRSKRAIAGSLGFLQALVWIFAVGNAVKHLDSPLHILGYAAGYACGTMVGDHDRARGGVRARGGARDLPPRRRRDGRGAARARLRRDRVRRLRPRGQRSRSSTRWCTARTSTT